MDKKEREARCKYNKRDWRERQRLRGGDASPQRWLEFVVHALAGTAS
jgi:hypothetical protein